MGRVARAIAIALAAVLLLAAIPTDGAALLRNGALTDGSGAQPDGWRPAGWNREATRFGWDPETAPPTLSLTNVEPNDAYWCQTVAVAPGGTYDIAAEIRTQDVGTGAAGAFISIEPRIGHSRLVTGTSAWRRIDLRLQAEGPERQWDVCLRLGSNGSLNTGTAWFRNVTMVLAALGPPPAQGPGVAGRLWQWARQTGWVGVLLPLGAGLMLAFGLGLLDRRRAPER